MTRRMRIALPRLPAVVLRSDAMRQTIGLVLVLSLCAGCSKSPARPSTAAPPASGSNSSAAPVAALEVRIDDGAPRDAIVSLSDIVVDASRSTGSGALTFAIDFGDGAVATSATTHHTYTTAGAFTIGATVTDAQGRTATDSKAIDVKAVTGRWFQAQYVGRSRRVEIRRLTIDAQDGLSVRGVYRTTGDADRSFTGTLKPPREIRLAISGGAGLVGLLPDALNDAAVPWTLLAQGDSVDGERLNFKALVGEPTGGPPVAEMTLRFGNDLPAPIPALTPVQIDGTASRGTELAYFIEFGDGSAVAASQGARVVDPGELDSNPTFVSRLTVVDRFGRSDTRTRDYRFFRIVTAGLDWWGSGYSADSRLWMKFSARAGTTYQVLMYGRTDPPYQDYRGSGSAVLSGDGNILVTIPTLGVEYRGTVNVGKTFGDSHITLVQRGGRDDGRSWSLFYEPY